MEFKKDCPDNDCRTDLAVEANAEFEDYQGYFIAGRSNFDLDIKITKSGHPSYSSNIFVALPESLQFLKAVKVYGDPEVNCGFLEETTGDEADPEAEEDTSSLDYLQRQLVPEKKEGELMLVCSFGNPLYNDTGVRYSDTFCT